MGLITDESLEADLARPHRAESAAPGTWKQEDKLKLLCLDGVCGPHTHTLLGWRILDQLPSSEPLKAAASSVLTHVFLD